MRLLLKNRFLRCKVICLKASYFGASGLFPRPWTEKSGVFLPLAVDSVGFCGTLSPLSWIQRKAPAGIHFRLARFLLKPLGSITYSNDV